MKLKRPINIVASMMVMSFLFSAAVRSAVSRLFTFVWASLFVEKPI